jgi:tRNA-2-methylthio-N6-dimethylallyladenosine synthase
VSDIIVGFPSETEAQFQQTVDLLTELKFDTVHLAAYSPRPGTIAARELADDVPQREKKRRLAALEKLQENIVTEINGKLKGKTVEILVEGKQKGKWYGRTGSDKLVFFSDDANYIGKLVNLRIELTSPWSLQGIVYY